MQRQLFIIRHGKSSWESIVSDFDRPLTERGVKNAYEMADLLIKTDRVPELLYSSPAARALHTAVIMSREWDLTDDSLQIRSPLYLPEPDDIGKTLFEVPDEIRSVAVFGHNPGFTQFANRFSQERIENIPTAGVVIVTLELESWTGLFDARVVECTFEYPKKYK